MQKLMEKQQKIELTGHVLSFSSQRLFFVAAYLHFSSDVVSLDLATMGQELYFLMFLLVSSIQLVLCQ